MEGVTRIDQRLFQKVIDMAGMMRVPRSRGAISGLLLMLLGAWGALIPFIGPYWHYAYAPDNTWDYTTGRLLLEILPGAGAFLGGLLTLGSANRLAAMFGGWLAAVSGAWFVLGMPLSSIWGSPTVGGPVGGTTRRAVEYLGFFGGLGAVIVFFAALALGRFAVLGVREAEWAAAGPVAGEPYDERATAPTMTGRPGYDATEGTGATAARTGRADGRGHRLHWPGHHRHVAAR
jgi:hypothetical protein